MSGLCVCSEAGASEALDGTAADLSWIASVLGLKDIVAASLGAQS